MPFDFWNSFLGIYQKEKIQDINKSQDVHLPCVSWTTNPESNINIQGQYGGS